MRTRINSYDWHFIKLAMKEICEKEESGDLYRFMTASRIVAICSERIDPARKARLPRKAYDAKRYKAGKTGWARRHTEKKLREAGLK